MKLYANPAIALNRATAKKIAGVSPIICTLFIIFLLFLVCTKGYSQITLKVNDAPVDKVLDNIAKQTGYVFIYKESEIKIKSITVNLKNASLKETLDACFKAAPMDYEIVKKTVVLKPAANNQSQGVIPDIDIHGYVYDESHKGMPGASVRYIGPGELSATTNEAGFFVLRQVPISGRIAISFVGYQTDTISINGQLEINITLKSQVSQLKEVTVSTGYQTLLKEQTAGSFGKPDMKIFNDRTGSVDIISRLEGLVPGLAINPGTAINWNNNARLSTAAGVGNNVGPNGRAVALIRGTNSIGLPSEPLYVVNGVQVVNLIDINPDDIADITVLKDASAAAIWGAKAANGIVVITTKNGERNQKIKVTYKGFVNFMGKPNLKYIPVLNSSEYIQAAKETFDPVNYPYSSLATSFISPHEQILYDQHAGILTAGEANDKLDSLARINNSDQINDLLLNNAWTTHHTVSASGGGQNYTFYSSLSYTNSQLAYPGSSNKMYQVEINPTFMPTERIKIGLNASLNNIINRSLRSIAPQGNFLPYQLLKDADGNQIKMNYVQGLTAATSADYQARSRVNLDYYPLDDVNTGFSKADNITANLTANVSVKLFKGISFEGTYGYSRRPGTSTQYDDITNYKMRRQLVNFTVAANANTAPVYYLPNTGGRYVYSSIAQTDWTLRNQLVYNTALRKGKDQLSLQIGQEANEQHGNITTSTQYGYNLTLGTYPLLNYENLSQPLFGAVGSGFSMFNESPFNSLDATTRFTSYFGLLNYTFDHRYVVNGSIRKDKSNAFGAITSSTPKPIYSLGAKWIVSNESFIQDLSYINDLGLRISYGVTGNSPSGTQTSKDVLSASTDPVSGIYYGLSSAANDMLRWESTRVLNLGMDFAFLNNRISGSVDVYYKKTTDLLGSVTLNTLTGFPSVSGNIGSLKNRGVDITLRTVNVKADDITWSTGVNFSYNKNKLISYPRAQASLYTASGLMGSSYIEGYPLAPVFAYRYGGLDNVGDPQIKLADGTLVKAPNQGTATDARYMGTQIPPFNGGITNTVRYKNVSVTANVIYSLGGVMRRDVNTFYTGRLTGNPGAFDGNVNAEFMNRWKKPGDEAITNIPSYQASQFYHYIQRNTDYYRLADINVVSSSFAKLRDLTLSYDFSSEILKAIKVAHINVYAQTGNYLLWKNNKSNIDPEYQTTQGTRLVPSVSHTFSLGANVAF